MAPLQKRALISLLMGLALAIALVVVFVTRDLNAYATDLGFRLIVYALWIGVPVVYLLLINLTRLSKLKQVDETRILEALELTECVEVHYNDKMSTYMILLKDQEQVRELKPDYCRIKRVLADIGGMRLLVTAKGDEPFDFVYRFFPMNQLEDYACGSALTGLGPFWKARLGKSKLRASQVHDRGTDVLVEPLDKGVRLSSRARILVKGSLIL